jgi:prepilin-type N-terminal cleavage/methylation domain-containing protein
MIKNILRRYHRNQRGFSLIEILVSVAISAFIAVGIVISLHQIIIGGSNTRKDMRSTQYVQNTGAWIRQDVLMSQSILSGDNPTTEENETMTLYWAGASYKDTQDNDCIDYFEVSYYLDSKELRRKEYVTTKVYNSNGSLVDTIEDQGIAVISDNINGISINSENVSLVLSITALAGDAETEKTYEILPRATLIEQP